MIASELREWTVEKFEHLRLNKNVYNELSAIADRIDEKHAKTQIFCSRLEKAAADREDVTLFDVDYIPLPLDADGKYIHIGDKVTEHEDGHTFKVDGFMDWDGEWWVFMRDGVQAPANKCTHHHELTVEDVLSEMMRDAACQFYDDGSCRMGLTDEQFNKYAQKLQLREETE